MKIDDKTTIKNSDIKAENSANNISKKNKLKETILIALFISLFALLSIYGTLNYGSMKLTVQDLPLFIGAIMFGPYAGGIIGFCGMLINQMLTYGFTPTTLLWVMPQTLVGIILGYFFKKNIVFINSGYKFWLAIIISNISITILNTIVFIIDAKIFSYFNYVNIILPIPIRLMTSIVVSIVYACIIPPIVKMIKKIH